MSEANLSGTRVPRRTVVAGAGAAAVGAVVSLAACGTSSGTTATPSAPPAGSSAPSRGSAAPATGAVGTVADVPVGGGRIYADRGVVVTQPTAGEFRAFSTVCPHQGCAVSNVSNGQIICPCHRSTFGLDGAVRSGPAPRGLDPVPVTVDGDQLILG